MTGTPIHLFSALAVQKMLEDGMLDAFTAESGIELDVLFDPTTELARLIAEGARPDVIIAVTSAIDKFVEAGAFDPASIVRIGRIGLGVAIAPDAPAPDISTLDGFVTALTDARSVAYSKAGASGIYLQELLASLGVLDEVASKSTALEKGLTARAIVDGRADLAIQQLTELAHVPGVQIVGPLPDGAQTYTEFSIAVGGSDPRAFALRDYLSSKAALRIYADAGFDIA